jgi:hypothetical protein
MFGLTPVAASAEQYAASRGSRPARYRKGPRRLARPRTSPFHGGNTGSNPVGDAKTFQALAADFFMRAMLVSRRPGS